MRLERTDHEDDLVEALIAADEILKNSLQCSNPYIVYMEYAIKIHEALHMYLRAEERAEEAMRQED